MHERPPSVNRPKGRSVIVEPKAQQVISNLILARLVVRQSKFKSTTRIA